MNATLWVEPSKLCNVLTLYFENPHHQRLRAELHRREVCLDVNTVGVWACDCEWVVYLWVLESEWSSQCWRSRVTLYLSEQRDRWHWERDVVWKCNIYIHMLFFYSALVCFCVCCSLTEPVQTAWLLFHLLYSHKLQSVFVTMKFHTRAQFYLWFTFLLLLENLKLTHHEAFTQRPGLIFNVMSLKQNDT